MLKTRNKQIYEEAGEWLVRLRFGEMDAGAHKQMEVWCRESPHHIRAFLELSAIWEETEGADLASGKSTESLIARARASGNIVAWEGDGGATRRQEASASSNPPANTHGFGILKFAGFLSWRSAGLASVALACTGFGLVALNAYRHTHYATGTGEQRIVQLTDGSAVELNSNSRVRIVFSERERNVELVEGQALFKVAKDYARPFVVQSAGTRVRAVGTQFDVYRKDSGTRVTVVEGRVAVFVSRAAKKGTEGEVPSSTETQPPGKEGLLPPQLAAERPGGDGGSATVLVSSGEEVTVTDQEVPQARSANVRAATAWTQQELVFELTPLSEVAQEFNRYNARKLVISDPILAGFHVTGTFSAADPAALLRFLRVQPGIDVVETGGEIRISKK